MGVFGCLVSCKHMFVFVCCKNADAYFIQVDRALHVITDEPNTPKLFCVGRLFLRMRTNECRFDVEIVYVLDELTMGIL